MILQRSSVKPLPARPALRSAPRSTAAALVYDRLRSQILSLAIPPGAALSENELAKSFGVSRTPVREALLRLADEMLVEIVPKSGTTVSRIPYSQLPEAIAIRKVLEELAVRTACERASKSQLTNIWMQVERQREADHAGDIDAFHEADEAFHAAIADAAGYPSIWQLVKQVKLQVDRYRRLTLPETGRMARVIEEHAAVIAAIEKGDAARAMTAMRGHLEGLEHSLPNIRNLNPDYFVEDVGEFARPTTMNGK
ncbi:GntR family transcriptional regulator [uncultured Ferrovibrio sp.]|jgi:DNA-binding GntR family transcriptional regulator|uniref:GntR family transcriptional regulator n=1 Tax=uncultured Ferrovibrio sp. TaxID=1576913 RepID=UPI0026281AA7|nr:GntR family transcriptional regulator [uncultured Ferrovibrio sp.]